MTVHHLPAACPNCTHPVIGPFCSACGQETVIETPTILEFLHETLHHYVAAEGKIWRTLQLLIFAPGRLTAEYIAGRRKRYIRPMQLYLTLSFIFFLLNSLAGHNLSDFPGNVVVAADQSKDAIAKSGDLKADVDAEDMAQVTAVSNKFSSFLKGKWQRHLDAAGGSQEAAIGAIFDDAMHRVPMALFILMPLLALILNLVYFGRDLPYGGHLLFSIHLHAFMFAFLTLMLLPVPDSARSGIGFFVPLGYLLLAAKRFYGGRWIPAVLRSAVVAAIYGTCVSVALLVVLVFAFVH